MRLHNSKTDCSQIEGVQLLKLVKKKKSAQELVQHVEFGSVGFSQEEKPGVPGEKPLGARREPTTNSTHI